MNEISNKELSSFLQEVNSQEAAELPNDLLEDKAWLPNILERDKNKATETITASEFAEKTKLAKLAKREERKKQKREIITSALSDSFIDLNAPLSIDYKRSIIEIETARYTKQMYTCEAYINQTFRRFISIPRCLRKSLEICPQAILPMESFEYQASEDFGLGYTFTVSIDVPRIRSPKELVDYMSSEQPRSLMLIDKTIARFYYLKETRDKLEIQMANTLLKTNTFYDLLQVNAFWYKNLIDKLKEDATLIEKND